MEEILLYFALKYEGQFDKIFKALERKEKVDENLKKELMARLSSLYDNCQFRLSFSLKQINCPPFVLFYHGKLSVLDHHCIGVIGMRKPSEYGIYATNKLVKDLADLDYTIVSGMALGIDSIAHRCALHNKAKSVAVLGGGIDYIYPKGNSDIYNIMKSDHLGSVNILMISCPLKMVSQSVIGL